MGLWGLLGRGALIATLVASAVAGCGEDAAPAPRVVADELLRCDITTGPCQRGIYDSLTAMLDAEGYAMPTIRTISVDQHASEVRAGLDLDDLTGEDAATKGLRLMGFIPEQAESLTSTQAEYVINQVAAYYSRGSRAITVIDRDYDQGAAQVLLAHELIHAIQDSQFNLGTVSAGRTTEDDIISVRSVIEGDAVYSSFAWYFELRDDVPSLIDWQAIVAEDQALLRERVVVPSTALIDTASSFPYSFGTGFMAAAILDGGLPARTAGRARGAIYDVLALLDQQFGAAVQGVLQRDEHEFTTATAARRDTVDSRASLHLVTDTGRRMQAQLTAGPHAPR